MEKGNFYDVILSVGSTEFKDVEESVLAEILAYMYTGKASSLDKMVDSLLSTADISLTTLIILSLFFLSCSMTWRG